MNRCSGCAFTKGTDANQNTWTKAKVALCLLADEPFYCHMKEPKQVCAGFLEAYHSQPAQPEWRRELASGLLEMQQLAELGQAEAEFVTENFRDVIEAVMEEKGVVR